MLESRPIIHISKRSIKITSKEANFASTSRTDPLRSSSSFLPNDLPGPSPRRSPLSDRNASPIARSDLPTFATDSPEQEVSRAATLSRLSRFVYRVPTPTRQSREPSEPAKSPTMVRKPTPAPPSDHHRNESRGRSRSTSTELSGIQDVSESQWAQAVSSRPSDASSRRGSSLPLPGTQEGHEIDHAMGDEASGSDRVADQSPYAPRAEGTANKRRRLSGYLSDNHPSPPPARSTSLVPTHSEPPSPAAFAKEDRAANLAQSSQRSMNTDGAEDAYLNSMIDDRFIPDVFSDDEPEMDTEADPESEAAITFPSSSRHVESSMHSPSPDKSRRGVQRGRVVSPDSEDGESSAAESAQTGGDGGSGSEEGAEENEDEEEEAVDWTPSPPSQRSRPRASTQHQTPTRRAKASRNVPSSPEAGADPRRITSPLSIESRRRISTNRRAAVAARAAAKKYVVLSDEEDGEFDPDKGSDADSARGRLESAFERQYRKELEAESEGTEQDDEYDDDPDDPDGEEEAEEEVMELGTAFQVHDEEDIPPEAEADMEMEAEAQEEAQQELLRNMLGKDKGKGEVKEVDEFDFQVPDDFFAEIDIDALVSSGQGGNGVAAPSKSDARPPTLDDLFSSPPGARTAPPSSGPSNVSRSLAPMAMPLSSLLDKIHNTPAASSPGGAPHRKGKGSQSSPSKSGSKGKKMPLADAPTNNNELSSAPGTGAKVDTLTDNFIRVSVMPPREQEFYMNHWRRGQEGVAKAPMRLTAAAKKRSEAVEGLLAPLDASNEFADLNEVDLAMDDDEFDTDLQGPQGPRAPQDAFEAMAAMAATRPAGRRTKAPGPTKKRKALSQSQRMLVVDPNDDDDAAFGMDDFDFDNAGPQGETRSARGGRGRGRGRGRGGWWGAKRGGVKKKATGRAKK